MKILGESGSMNYNYMEKSRENGCIHQRSSETQIYIYIYIISICIYRYMREEERDVRD